LEERLIKQNQRVGRGKKNRINDEIDLTELRLIGSDGVQIGIVGIQEALAKARSANLDLVEISPDAEPPVCRIMDYGKWQYQQKRRIREAHKKHLHHITTLKEIRLRPETDKHDLDIKLNHAREFLAKGHKVQFTMFFRGRQMLHRDRGYAMLEQITESLQDLSKVERPARMAGRRMTLLVVPK